MKELKRAKTPQEPTLIMVSPEIAAKWLEANVHNRKLTQGTVDHYAEQMRRGEWHLNHQGIAFNCEGTLVDGQHRLWAIIEAGVTLPMVVMTGLPLESQETIDCNLQRTFADRATLTGKFGEVSNDVASVTLRVFHGCKQTKKLGPVEQNKLLAKHIEAVRFAIAAFPRKRGRVTTVATKAVIARAFYTQDKEDLLRFANVMVTGEAKQKRDAGILALVEGLMRGRNFGLSFTTLEVYDRVQRHLKAWLDGRTMTRYSPSHTPLNLFPIPGEKRAKVKKKDAGPTTSRVVDWFKRNKTGTTSQCAKALKMTNEGARQGIVRAREAGWLKLKRKNRGGRSESVFEYVTVER